MSSSVIYLNSPWTHHRQHLKQDHTLSTSVSHWTVYYHSRPSHTSQITSSYTAPCNADDPLKTRSHWSHHIQLHSSLQCWRPTRDPVTLVSSHPATQLHSLPTTHLCSTASNLETLTTVLAKWNLSFNLNLGTRDNVPISWYPSQCALSYQTGNGKCGHK